MIVRPYYIAIETIPTCTSNQLCQQKKVPASASLLVIDYYQNLAS